MAMSNHERVGKALDLREAAGGTQSELSKRAPGGRAVYGKVNAAVASPRI